MATDSATPWWGWVLMAVVFYCLLILLARWMSEQMAYFPTVSGRYDRGSVVFVPTSQGPEWAVRMYASPENNRGIFYFHGNAEDIAASQPFLLELGERTGWTVATADYPGYGWSTGRPSEDAIWNGAPEVFLAVVAKTRIPLEQWVVYGRSLGGAAALSVASRHPVAGVVLQSTFTSLYRVMTHWPILLFDRYPNLRVAPSVQSPWWIIHGKADSIIHPRHSRKLAEAMGGPGTLWLVEGADHNNLEWVAGEIYWEKWREFLTSLPEDF